jgi:hypothetical protein
MSFCFRNRSQLHKGAAIIQSAQNRLFVQSTFSIVWSPSNGGFIVFNLQPDPLSLSETPFLLATSRYSPYHVLSPHVFYSSTGNLNPTPLTVCETVVKCFPGMKSREVFPCPDSRSSRAPAGWSHRSSDSYHCPSAVSFLCLNASARRVHGQLRHGHKGQEPASATLVGIWESAPPPASTGRLGLWLVTVDTCCTNTNVLVSPLKIFLVWIIITL